MSTQSPLQTGGILYTANSVLRTVHFHFTESYTKALSLMTDIFKSYRRESTNILLMAEFHLWEFLLLYMLFYSNGLLGYLMDLCHH